MYIDLLWDIHCMCSLSEFAPLAPQVCLVHCDLGWQMTSSPSVLAGYCSLKEIS